jgi:hypothetical protein
METNTVFTLSTYADGERERRTYCPCVVGDQVIEGVCVPARLNEYGKSPAIDPSKGASQWDLVDYEGGWGPMGSLEGAKLVRTSKAGQHDFFGNALP